MSTQLRGSLLPNPRFYTAPLSSELLHVEGYKHLQTFFPTLTKVFRLGKWNAGGDEIWMDTRWRIVGIDCSGTAGPCTVTLKSNKDASGTSLRTQRAFLKTTHLLDPIHWIQGDYSLPKENGMPWHHKAWQKAWQKLQDPGNQAYIDSVAAYSLGRIREEDLSPHFNIFYGSFCARADKYRYNLTDDFGSYRHERWFWKGHNKNLFAIKVVNIENPEEPVSPEVMKEVLQQYGNSQSGSDSDSSEELDEISLEEDEAASIHSADSMSDVSFAASAIPESEDDDGDDTHNIYAEIVNYPVMLIITEESNGTMDALFENHEEVGCKPGTAGWDARWSAWTFQIIAALSCAQSLLGFTHNDLHTNNILWSKTDMEYVVYTTRAGNYFKVPTFGKIFRIIDFGRAIFTINKYQFISDDFKAGNDAEGQYVFSPLCQKVTKQIPPNPSFDLSRLAVSMIDGIYPMKPASRKNGCVLSSEKDLVVYETESPLYNLLWKWMVDDNGKNIFVNADGSERFPAFDLYKHIAEFIHSAIPSQQIFAEAFSEFQVEASIFPSDQKKYSLFC